MKPQKLIVTLCFVFLFFCSFGQVRWEQIKPISAQVETTTPANGDLILIQDTSDNSIKYVKVENLVNGGAIDSVGYENLKDELTGSITDNDGSIDFSLTGIVNASFSTNTSVTFSNLQQNKVLKIKLTLSSSAVVTWPTSQVFGDDQEDGTFYVWADCWGTTAASLVITLRKAQ